MKKVTVAVFLMLLSGIATAQSEKFIKAMSANLGKMDSARTPQDFLAVAANFERIALAEKGEWLPYYYAAEAQVLYGFFLNVPAGNDGIADKAEQLLGKADSLQKNNSEVSCVRSMIGTLRMLVNPMQRYMQFAQVIEGSLEMAKKQDPANPRPYYLQGQNLKNTPPQFGGGCKTAKPVLEQAMKLYGEFKPASPLHPAWGKQKTEELLAGCK